MCIIYAPEKEKAEKAKNSNSRKKKVNCFQAKQKLFFVDSMSNLICILCLEMDFLTQRNNNYIFLFWNTHKILQYFRAYKSFENALIIDIE